MRGHPVRNGAVLAFVGAAALAVALLTFPGGVTRQEDGSLFVMRGERIETIRAYRCEPQAQPGEDPGCPSARRDDRMLRRVVLPAILVGTASIIVGSIWASIGTIGRLRSIRARERSSVEPGPDTWEPDEDAWRRHFPE